MDSFALKFKTSETGEQVCEHGVGEGGLCCGPGWLTERAGAWTHKEQRCVPRFTPTRKPKAPGLTSGTQGWGGWGCLSLSFSACYLSSFTFGFVCEMESGYVAKMIFNLQSPCPPSVQLAR